ncbi:MAG TPA: sensor histidine kinase [Xanthomonadaceae bacterium]|nr:sensor histidine kinase [Xanthomonadaceae bacterium]
MTMRFSHTQLLRYAGLFTWACMGVPLVFESFQQGLTRTDIQGWRFSYFLFGACYWLLTRAIGKRQPRPADLFTVLLLTASAIAVSHFSDSGLGGSLLLITAGVLPWFLPLHLGVAWLVLQFMALVPVFASRLEFRLVDAVLQAILFLGYSAFIFIVSLVARQQAEAREQQRQLNAELRATRALLAESTRLNERMRIARELHDLLGHHLTALSLNLEVASHLSQGRALENVRQSQSLAKLLLGDVREAVSQLREDDAIDLTEALRSLADGVPSLDVRLDLSEPLMLNDPRRAQVLLRCAQEIITNTVRHAGADTLWLRIAHEGDAVIVHAHDDGKGVDAVRIGNGLAGMRERLAEFGGRLEFESARGKGFRLDLHLPVESTA